MSEPEYLGDSVYAQNDGYQIELFTFDGLNVSNKIYLEPQVIKRLIEYWEQMMKERKEK